MVAVAADHMEGPPGGLGFCFDVLYGIQIIGTFAFPVTGRASFLRIPSAGAVGIHAIVTVEADLGYFASGKIP